jgi:hypothetical protein
VNIFSGNCSKTTTPGRSVQQISDQLLKVDSSSAFSNVVSSLRRENGTRRPWIPTHQRSGSRKVLFSPPSIGRNLQRIIVQSHFNPLLPEPVNVREINLALIVHFCLVEGYRFVDVQELIINYTLTLKLRLHEL